MFGKFLGWSKNDATKIDPPVQEKVDTAELPPDLATIHEPFVVSQKLAKEIMLDPPDRSAEDAASIVNHLAFNNVLTSSPKHAVPGKRKRQEVDMVDESPKKRVVLGGEITEIRDEPLINSTNGDTGHGGRPDRLSLEVVKEAPGKLPRPKKGHGKRHMMQVHSAVQRSGDIWDPQPSPVKQGEKQASLPTTTTTKATIPAATPRPRGRPPRVKPSPTTKTISIKKGQGRKKQDLQVKPWRKGRPEGFVNPGVESREDYGTPIETSPQETQPKAAPKSSRTKYGDDHREGAPNSKSTRSSAAANGLKDGILNANVDLTKKPERDARRAAKQRRNLEHASVSSPPSPRVDSQVKERTRDIAMSVRNGENPARARAQKASDEGQEEEEFERDGRRYPEKATDRDEQTSFQPDEGEEGGTEADEQDSDLESPTEVMEIDKEEDEREEELELFGQNEAWKTVLKGARSICGQKLPLNLMPKLLTESMKDLIQDVREARGLYEQLLPFKGMDHESLDGLNDQLEDSLAAIEDQIRRLSEKTAAPKGSEMIRDIYARAIPAMVFLLQSALASRLYYSDQPCDLETLNETVNGLREIVNLQKMAILLCEKATHWKAKPVPTSRPIVRPTTRKIFPCLKDMRKAFSKNLVEQDRKRKMKQNAVDYSKRPKELAQSSQQSQQAQQDTARKNETLHEMIRASREQEDETRRTAKRTFRQIKEDEARARMGSHQVNGHVESRTTWSKTEDIALYFQLEKGYAGGLTSMFTRSHQLCNCCSLTTLAAEERYLNILNAPLLQNKLPEHIRERALYFKPTLLEERGALEWISSIE